jgi:hypothetical protein
MDRRAVTKLLLCGATHGVPLERAWAQARPSKPRLPAGRDPGGVAIAVIGGGIDYTAPDIASRVARDGEGELIGWDMADNDRQPFEVAPVDGRTLLPASGTEMARLILREAGAGRLIPIRISGGDEMGVGRGLAFATLTPAKVVASFAAAALTNVKAPFWPLVDAARGMIFIVPAGHSGTDRDSVGLPVAFANLLTVTAAASDGTIFRGASWGQSVVDIAVPLGDSVAVGAAAPALENAAVARVAAMASRIAATSPALDGAALKARILSYSKPLSTAEPARTRTGWIEDIGRLPAR